MQKVSFCNFFWEFEFWRHLVLIWQNSWLLPKLARVVNKPSTISWFQKWFEFSRKKQTKLHMYKILDTVNSDAKNSNSVLTFNNLNFV